MWDTLPDEYVRSVDGQSKRGLQYCAHHAQDERDADTSTSATHSVDHAPPLREQYVECYVQLHSGKQEYGYQGENQLHHRQCREQPQQFPESAQPVALCTGFVRLRNGVTCRESSELLYR